jgi:hypothetical protein
LMILDALASLLGRACAFCCHHTGLLRS